MTNFAGPIRHELSAGLQIGDMRLEEKIGRGGMGEVWKAWNEIEKRHVVIKVLPRELTNVPEELNRVRHTFQQIHQLHHQNICPVYSFGDHPEVGPYLVLKYVDGITLAAYHRQFVDQHGQFPVEELIRVLEPVAAALDYAHSKKVVHRDIKPDNIMLRPDGSEPLIVDFGLATEIRTSMTRISKVQMDTSGTYPYMAPEQWRGRSQDARTDQYALGVVAYELLAGSPPFEAPDDFILRQCVLSEEVEPIEGVPEHINSAILQALAKAREERWGSCAEFLQALLQPADTAQTAHPPQTAVPQGAGAAQAQTTPEAIREQLRRSDEERYKSFVSRPRSERSLSVASKESPPDPVQTRPTARQEAQRETARTKPKAKGQPASAPQPAASSKRQPAGSSPKKKSGWLFVTVVALVGAGIAIQAGKKDQAPNPPANSNQDAKRDPQTVAPKPNRNQAYDEPLPPELGVDGEFTIDLTEELREAIKADAESGVFTNDVFTDEPLEKSDERPRKRPQDKKSNVPESGPPPPAL